MDYQVSLPNFEGPLDLLFHLVKKAEVDIYEISITEITDQYIAYLHQWEKLNLEIASEFLVMAARLMELKSRELLPKRAAEAEEEEEQQDPKQELINKIVEYQYFKEIADHLKEQEKKRYQLYWRDHPKLPGDINNQETLKVGDIGIHDLLSAFHRVIKKYHQTNQVAKIDTREVSITEQRDKLLNILSQHQDHTMYFEELFQKFSTRIEIVATFLALLDLVKERLIIVSQQGISSPLWLQLRETKS